MVLVPLISVPVSWKNVAARALDEYFIIKEKEKKRKIKVK
jgi:hypothetical protein